MNAILEYLRRTYQPLALIVYGSYADGTNNPGSDFDALVITADHAIFHDVSFVDGVQLDVFVYPAAHFDGDFDCDSFAQISDGHILMDTRELAAQLQARVLRHLDSLPGKTPAEIRADVEWCRKMFLRTRRCDAEGVFRWHWLLTDSLEIFCEASGHAYRGPKKALRWMEREYPEAFRLYAKALAELSEDSLERWIAHLEQLC